MTIWNNKKNLNLNDFALYRNSSFPRRGQSLRNTAESGMEELVFYTLVRFKLASWIHLKHKL